MKDSSDDHRAHAHPRDIRLCGGGFIEGTCSTSPPSASTCDIRLCGGGFIEGVWPVVAWSILAGDIRLCGGGFIEGAVGYCDGYSLAAISASAKAASLKEIRLRVQHRSHCAISASAEAASLKGLILDHAPPARISDIRLCGGGFIEGR